MMNFTSVKILQPHNQSTSAILFKRWNEPAYLSSKSKADYQWGFRAMQEPRKHPSSQVDTVCIQTKINMFIYETNNAMVQKFLEKSH